jgi:hypothetical protein
MFTRTDRMRRAALQQTSNYGMAVAIRLNREVDRYDGFEMFKAWNAATPDERASYAALEPELISVAEFDFLLSLNERFNTALTQRLKAEDFNYIANARCMYMDAVEHAGRGVHDEALMFGNNAVKRMDFVINKRKRNAENRDYHNIPEYPRIWQDLRLLLEDMHRAVALLERAHKAVQR